MKVTEIEKLLDKVHDWIKGADQKVSISLALQIGVLALITVPTAKLVQRAHEYLVRGQVLMLVVAVCLFAYGIFKAIWSLKPRLRLPKAMTSLLYFESIARMDPGDFSQKLRALREPSYKKDLADQIHVSAVIASKKHRALAESLTLFIFAVLVWVIVVAWIGYEALMQ